MPNSNEDSLFLNKKIWIFHHDDHEKNHKNLKEKF